jgi:hypothetical protein
MKSKSDAHETLSLLLKREGVPPEMIMDGAKEQIQGKFKDKLKEANCHLKQTEPYSPWQNYAEDTIREVKRSLSCKMIKTGSPKKLWDHSLELEALVKSHTVSDIYMLDGETPETVMKGDVPDISQLAEFAWYDWVMYCETADSYPDGDLVLGRYLGPTRDVGPMMTTKILKSNSEYVPRSTFRHLTPEELLFQRISRYNKHLTQAWRKGLDPPAHPMTLKLMN